MYITERSVKIKVKGHVGTWYVIDSTYTPDKGMIFLLESEIFGDEAPSVIVDRAGRLLLENVYNGFDDYYESEWD